MASPSRSGSVARIRLVGVLHARWRSRRRRLRRRPSTSQDMGEVLVRAHRAVLGRQIAHMAIGRQDLVVLWTEIFIDGFCLGQAISTTTTSMGGQSFLAARVVDSRALKFFWNRPS